MTVEQFDELVNKVFELRQDKDALEDKVKEINKEITRISGHCIAYLDMAERKNYRAPKGTITVQQSFNLSLPKSWEDKQKLMNYLRDKGEGVLEKYLTFNAAEIKSFVKAEILAREEMGDLDTSIPGLETPKTYKKLGFNKARSNAEERLSPIDIANELNQMELE